MTEARKPFEPALRVVPPRRGGFDERAGTVRPTAARRVPNAIPVSAYERTIQILCVVMIVSSTLMRTKIPIGVGDLYLAQILAIALAPLAFWRHRSVRGVLGVVLVTLAICAFASVASLPLPDPGPRFRVLIQLAINSFSMVVLFSLLSRLPRPAVRQVVVFLCWAFLLAAMAQVVLAPEWNFRGTTTFGIPRPVILFQEEGNPGQFAALLFCAAIAVGARYTAILPAFLVVLADNRGGYIIALTCLLIAIPWIQTRRWARTIVFAVPLLLGAVFVLSVLLDWSLPVLNENTGRTRQSDVQAILFYNGSLFPWGGSELNIFDESRSRQLQDTINIWPVDLMWKYGFGGLVMLAAWAWALLSRIPRRISPAGRGPTFWIPLAALVGLLADLQFNNPSGYPWMWMMVGVLLATMADRSTTTDVNPPGGRRGKTHRVQPAAGGIYPP